MKSMAMHYIHFRLPTAKCENTAKPDRTTNVACASFVHANSTPGTPKFATTTRTLIIYHCKSTTTSILLLGIRNRNVWLLLLVLHRLLIVLWRIRTLCSIIMLLSNILWCHLHSMLLWGDILWLLGLLHPITLWILNWLEIICLN